MKQNASNSRNQGATALPTPDVAAIYMTVIAATVTLVCTMWALQFLVYPAVPAARYTLLAAIALMPSILVVTWPGSAPQAIILTTFVAYSTAVTVGIHYGGGADNVSGPLLYTVVIGLAGLIVSGGAAYAVAVGSSVMYAALICAERFGFLPHHLSYTKSGPDAVATVIAVGLYLTLVAWVVSSTVRQIRATHRRAEELRSEAVNALSHDLKNPLGAIRSYAELAETAPAGDNREYLRHIRRAAQHALDLVNNVLDAAALAARPMTPEHRPVQLNDLVADTAELYAAAAEAKGIKLSVTLAPDLPVVDADGQLFRRMLSNLISNAIKFTGEGGEVRVRTTSVNESRVRLIVSDTGCGIAPRDRPHLFSKYRRGRSGPDTGGTGLGLYIVRSIVDAHAGEVSVESDVGQGAVFTIDLPLRR
ncbi:HAMP domain-containing histidine kinase [Candidatus Binatia bacterium]|nr:HAMP domain-containing histidine kinase [Candidatus Binatia bacterium]